MPGVISIDEFEHSICEHTFHPYGTPIRTVITRYTVHEADARHYGFTYDTPHGTYHLDLYTGIVCTTTPHPNHLRWIYAVHGPSLGVYVEPRFARVIKMN